MKAALGQVPLYQATGETEWQFRQKRLAALGSLMKQYPDDLSVQRAYIQRLRELKPLTASKASRMKEWYIRESQY